MRLFVPRAIVVDGLAVDHVPGDDIVGGIVAKYDCRRQIGLIWQAVADDDVIVAVDQISDAVGPIESV